MKKPALPLLALTIALVIGLPLLLSQMGASDGTTAPALMSGGDPLEAAEPPEGELPGLDSGGGARDVAPRLDGGGPSDPGAGQLVDINTTPSERRRLRGRVVNPTGGPVVGARVSVGRDWGGAFVFDRGATEESITNSEGYFESAWLPANKLVVGVKAAGYAPLNARVERPTGVDLGTFELEEGVTLRGVVLDAHGIPVSDVGVSFQDQDHAEWSLFLGDSSPSDTKTASDGSFSLDTVAVGPWVVEAKHTMHPTTRLSGLSERPGLHPEQVVIRLTLGGSVTGYVEGYSGEPDCFVLASKHESSNFGLDPNMMKEGSVDSAGRFELHGLSADTDYSLALLRRSEEGSMFGEPLGEPVTVRAGQVGVVLVMKGAKGISFRVINSATGAPVEAFTAKTGGWWMEPLQDAEGKVLTQHEGGRALVEDVKTQGGEDLRLQIFAEGFESRELEGIQLPPEGLLELGDIALKPAPMLRIKVIADATSLPVEGARVTLSVPAPQEMGAITFGEFEEFGETIAHENPRDARIEGRSKRTNADGVVSLTTIPGESASLKVTHRKFSERALQPRVYSGGDVEVRLFAGGTVRVRVLTADGTPAERGVRVSHRFMREHEDLAASYGSQDTSSSGSVTFKNLEAGSHAFRIADEERSGNFIMAEGIGGSRGAVEKEWEMVEVSEGSESELLLRQAARGVVYGRVTEGGRPLPRASLRLDPWSGGDEGSLEERLQRRQMVFFMGGNDVQSKADGSYRMEDAEVGVYELVVSHPLRAMDEYFRVTLTPGEVELNIDLPSTAIEGVVVNQDGDPVEGAEVVVRRAGDSAQGGVAMITSMSSSSEFHVRTSGGSGPTRTDGAGHFRVQGLATGCELVLKVAGGSYQTEELAIDPLRPGEVKSGLRVELIEGGSMELTLLMPDGRESEFGAVALRKLIDGEPEGESRHVGAEDGKARIDGLSPGEWRVTATTFNLRDISQGQGPDSSEQEQIVKVKAGEVTEVLLQF